MINKNYYMISGDISISDFFSALYNLCHNGILILSNVPKENEDIFEKLKIFEVKEKIEGINCGESITFKMFTSLKTKDINIIYSAEAKNILLDLSIKHIPEYEICQCIYYLNPNTKKIILEWNSIGLDDIYISRYEINSDTIIRKFCEDIGVDSYCLEMFEK